MGDRPDGLFFDDFASDSDPDPRRRDRRLLRWLMLAVVVLVGGLYVTGYLLTGDRLPRSATVAGVDVGGMRPERAQRVVRDALVDRLHRPIAVQVDDREFQVSPEDAGLDIDVPASVGQVPVGRSWDVADMWETLVGGDDYDPVVVVVDDLLTERLEQIEKQVSRPPVEGSVRFTRDGAQPTYPQAGETLDVPAAADAVEAAFLAGKTDVQLSTVDDPPDVSPSAISRAMQRFANPAMSASVVLDAGRRRIVLRPADYASVLSMTARNGRLVPQVNKRRLLAAVTPVAGRMVSAPRDATFRIVDGRPVLVPARAGVEVDADRLARTFLALVVASEGEREADLPTTAAQPDLTTKEARRLGVRELVSEFTTYYPHADYRNVNIGRAAQLVDGTLLEPGQRFSLNDVVGERTERNGFTKGFVIDNGVFSEDLGGGVSQVATTTFNAAFFAGLEDVEHKPHSFYIDRYPVGREATVAWPSVDLRFRNDTRYGVLVQAVHVPSTPSTQGSVTVRLWSTKVWDITARTSERYAFTQPTTRYGSGDSCVPNQGYAGFQVDVTRVFRRAGRPAVDHTERMHTTYIPADTVICR